MHPGCARGVRAVGVGCTGWGAQPHPGFSEAANLSGHLEGTTDSASEVQRGVPRAGRAAGKEAEQEESAPGGGTAGAKAWS